MERGAKYIDTFIDCNAVIAGWKLSGQPRTGKVRADGLWRMIDEQVAEREVGFTLHKVKAHLAKGAAERMGRQQ